MTFKQQGIMREPNPYWKQHLKGPQVVRVIEARVFQSEMHGRYTIPDAKEQQLVFLLGDASLRSPLLQQLRCRQQRLRQIKREGRAKLR